MYIRYCCLEAHIAVLGPEMTQQGFGNNFSHGKEIIYFGVGVKGGLETIQKFDVITQEPLIIERNAILHCNQRDLLFILI